MTAPALTFTVPPSPARRVVLRRRIRLLVAATISYNVVEAGVALAAGAADACCAAGDACGAGSSDRS